MDEHLRSLKRLAQNDPEARIRWENAKARAGCGVFMLWHMTEVEDSAHRHNNYTPSYTKYQLKGVFPSREIPEQIFQMAEEAPSVMYEFKLFTDIDEVEGGWGVEISDDGERITREDWCFYSDRIGRSYRHGEDRITGYARTKPEAVAKAQAYRLLIDKWNREEKPKRPEKCYCQPHGEVCARCDPDWMRNRTPISWEPETEAEAAE